MEYKVGDLVLVKRAGDNDGCKGGPEVGAMWIIAEIRRPGFTSCGHILIKNSWSGKTKDTWFTVPEKLTLAIAAKAPALGPGDDTSYEPKATVPEKLHPELGSYVKSLSGDYKSVSHFVAAQVRGTGDTPYMLRFQWWAGDGDVWERQANVSKAMVRWIARRPHLNTSLAGSGAKYVPCRLRRTANKPYVRLQIAGPPVNRPYGLCALLKSESLWTSLPEKKGGE